MYKRRLSSSLVETGVSWRCFDRLARPASGQPTIFTLRAARKDTQRDRLMDGMTHVASSEGYAGATVAKVIAHAGVSRPTFYDYFANREDCFLAALADVQERTLLAIGKAVANASAEDALRVTLTEMIDFAASDLKRARLLNVQALTGPPRALDARDQTLQAIARPIEDALGEMPATALAPDLSARVILGAVERLLAARLKGDEPLASDLLDGVLGWVRHYEGPIGAHRWRALQPVARAEPSSLRTRLAEPPPLPPGRSRLAREDVEANHRRRILIAAARASVGKGFASTTATEIATLARVDGRVFHRLFPDRQALLADLVELSFQHVMSVTIGAFFSAKSWPERVWEAGRAFAECLEENHMLAHMAFIETYAGGPKAVRRAEGFLNAFTLFLREGQEQGEKPSPLPRLALDAIAAANFEIVYRQVRACSTPELMGLLPHVTYLTLAPFLGSAAVAEFIELRAAHAPRSA
jgi:AcrR family transcriptional regulator